MSSLPSRDFLQRNVDLALESKISVIRSLGRLYRSYLCSSLRPEPHPVSNVYFISSFWCVCNVYILLLWVGNNVLRPQCTCGGGMLTVAVGPPSTLFETGSLAGMAVSSWGNILWFRTLIPPLGYCHLQMCATVLASCEWWASQFRASVTITQHPRCIGLALHSHQQS